MSRAELKISQDNMVAVQVTKKHKTLPAIGLFPAGTQTVFDVHVDFMRLSQSNTDTNKALCTYVQEMGACAELKMSKLDIHCPYNKGKDCKVCCLKLNELTESELSAFCAFFKDNQLLALVSQGYANRYLLPIKTAIVTIGTLMTECLQILSQPCKEVSSTPERLAKEMVTMFHGR